MKWGEKVSRPRGRDTTMRRLVWFLIRCQSFFIRTISSNPIFSDKDRDNLIKDYRSVVDRCIEGLRRMDTPQITEGWEPEKHLFSMDDTTLRVRFEKSGEDTQYFISLGLNLLERLYLTNRVTEERYFKYRQVFRYLPRLTHDLLRRSERGT